MKILFVLVVIFFLMTPAIGQEKIVDKNDLILKQLAEISKSIADLKKDNDTRLGKNEKDIDQLRQEVAKLRTKLEQRPVPPVPPVPLVTQPEDRIPPTIPLIPGRVEERVVKEESIILVTNSWVAPANIQVNGVWHKVPMASSVFIRVAPGTFIYQVAEAGHKPQERKIVVGEIYKIDIYTICR